MDKEMKRFVQPIIVPKSNKSEYHTAIAVAMASHWNTNEYKNYQHWQEWLNNSYGKTVRRSSAATFDKLLAYAQSSLSNDSLIDDFYTKAKIYTYRGDSAIAYEPITYDDMPKLIRKCQVAGTEFDKSQNMYLKDMSMLEDVSSPIIVVNNSLGMSSGKIAAQVAHGYWCYLEINSSAVESYSNEPTIYYADSLIFDSLKDVAKSVIVDSGLTELSGKNTTVLVL